MRLSALFAIAKRPQIGTIPGAHPVQMALIPVGPAAGVFDPHGRDGRIPNGIVLHAFGHSRRLQLFRLGADPVSVVRGAGVSSRTGIHNDPPLWFNRANIAFLPRVTMPAGQNFGSAAAAMNHSRWSPLVVFGGKNDWLAAMRSPPGITMALYGVFLTGSPSPMARTPTPPANPAKEAGRVGKWSSYRDLGLLLVNLNRAADREIRRSLV